MTAPDNASVFDDFSSDTDLTSVGDDDDDSDQSSNSSPSLSPQRAPESHPSPTSPPSPTSFEPQAVSSVSLASAVPDPTEDDPPPNVSYALPGLASRNPGRGLDCSPASDMNSSEDPAFPSDDNSSDDDDSQMQLIPMCEDPSPSHLSEVHRPSFRNSALFSNVPLEDNDDFTEEGEARESGLQDTEDLSDVPPSSESDSDRESSHLSELDHPDLAEPLSQIVGPYSSSHLREASSTHTEARDPPARSGAGSPRDAGQPSDHTLDDSPDHSLDHHELYGSAASSEQTPGRPDLTSPSMHKGNRYTSDALSAAVLTHFENAPRPQSASSTQMSLTPVESESEEPTDDNGDEEDDEDDDDDRDDEDAAAPPAGNSRSLGPGMRTRQTAAQSGVGTALSPSQGESDVDHEEESLHGEPEDDTDLEALRQEAIKELTRIEEYFVLFREKWYREQMDHLEREYAEVESGEHPQLIKDLKLLESHRENRMMVAKAQQDQIQLSTEKQYQCAIVQADCTFNYYRARTRQELIHDIMLRKHILHQDKRKLDCPDSVSFSWSAPDRSLLNKRRKTIKAELSELMTIREQGGFPACGIPGLSKADIQEDLEALGILRPSERDRTNPRSNRSKGATTEKEADSGVKYANGSGPAALGPLVAAPVRIEGEILLINESQYRKGDRVNIQDSNTTKFLAKLVAVNDAELTFQRTDGSRTRIPLTSLIDGKTTLTPKI
ncbi:Sds3-like-domain-containing protein [Polychytrium aggregatum]|uniref:Sds3-like-domain-containing protein n=1 Tax=Polychytrium aggregatum TaxID=110093 RepID=UPI0022FF060E|nr:Sds3-like-domain-containing protein [Polychytrium aggregatum]KAI9204549.1 Sds3-like-domain-containing protein [Polychytrium aggregatum]